MAKQSGIHQLRGKVGEMSYYRTKGVQDGVVRRINQGMSQRVKMGDEYANTRLNNAEFKNANAIATVAFNSVKDRKRGMMQNFAVAKMTKAALDDIKQGTGSWGVRLPQTELDTLICNLLENHAKGGVYDGMFGTISASPLTNQGESEIVLNWSAETARSLVDIGIDGVQIVVSKCLAGEVIVDNLPRLFAGSNTSVAAPVDFDPEAPEQISTNIDVFTPLSVGMSPSGYTFAKEDPKHGFYAVVTILPYRKRGFARYTLVEHCTYVAIPLGQIPK